jgi:hypothetical protein
MMSRDDMFNVLRRLNLVVPMFKGMFWHLGALKCHECGCNHMTYLQAKMVREDSETGAMGIGGGSKRYISPHTTPSELVLACMALGRDFAEHELREAFEYKGQKILKPHFDVDQLALFAAEGNTDARPAPANAERYEKLPAFDRGLVTRD